MFTNIIFSARNLKNTRALVLAAMLIALHAVLGIFKIPFALSNRITLTFAVSAAAGIILGPVPAALVCGLGDILGYFLNPGGGAYFFGFTLSAMAGGFIYGLLLYQKDKKYIIWRIIAAAVLIMALVNIILNTFWLHILYGQAYQIFAPARILKNLVLCPVHIIVIYAVFMLTEKTGIRKKYS